MTTAT